MRRILAVVAFVAVGCAGRGLAAQSAVARADVALHRDHSRKSGVQGTLAAGDTATLLSATPVAGYYNLRTLAGTEGWAYGRYLSILGGGPAPTPAPSPTPQPQPQPTPQPQPQPPPSTTTVATAVDPGWEKPAPDTRAFDRGALGTCGPDGQGGDALTNHRKNRVDEPALYHPVTFAAVAGLPYPRNHKPSRQQWSASELAVIAPYEGAAVTVTGFVARGRGVIVEDAQNSKSGESTNCHMLDDAGVDWHVTLVQQPGDPKSAGIVVETTPRVRANGHSWTPDPLLAAAAAGDSVRVSGWLMYDPEHYAQTASYDASQPGPFVRATLWEIHPITRLEVFDPATRAWRALP